LFRIRTEYLGASVRLTTLPLRLSAFGIAILLLVTVGAVWLFQLATTDVRGTDSADSPTPGTSPPSDPSGGSAEPPAPSVTQPAPSPITPTARRTGQTPTPRAPTTPYVKIGGPTLDNAYPDDTGCHLLWVATPGLVATVRQVSASPGTVPSPPTDPNIPPARQITADYVSCQSQDGAPATNTGCGTGIGLSVYHACGVRPTIGTPTRPGTYGGTLRFDLFTVCRNRQVQPCAAIQSPYPPSADRPVEARWSVDCPIALTVTDEQAVESHRVDRCAVRS
jgi:hypothetical protein